MKLGMYGSVIMIVIVIGSFLIMDRVSIKNGIGWSILSRGSRIIVSIRLFGCKVVQTTSNGIRRRSNNVVHGETAAVVGRSKELLVKVDHLENKDGNANPDEIAQL